MLIVNKFRKYAEQVTTFRSLIKKKCHSLGFIQNSIKIKIKIFISECTKCSVGAFQSGVNAGGQIACEGFANNPQYLLTVNDGKNRKRVNDL